MLLAMKKTVFKLTLISAFLIFPVVAYAGGCEDDAQRWMPEPDAQSCAAAGGSWFVCTRDGVALNAEDRHSCEGLHSGVWSPDNTPVEVYGLVPKVSSSFVELHGRKYFIGDDGVSGTEVWSTDGTASGTRLLKDITNASVIKIENLSVVDNRLFFTIGDYYTGQQLWSSDGTPMGTQQLVAAKKRISRDAVPVVAFEGKWLFTENEGLWQTDGTTAGTELLKGGIDAVTNLTVAGNRLYFSARSSDTSTVELWTSDGTTVGTHLVKNINPNGSSYPSNYKAFGNKLLLKAKDANGFYGLWISDGTDIGTTELKSINVSGDFITLGQQYLMYAADSINGGELWLSDGTANGTVLVKDINQGSGNSYINLVAELNGIGYFSADDGTHGTELWRTDGSDSGTYLLKDIAVGTSTSAPNHVHIVDNKLLFVAKDSAETSLWVSDGTANNTVKVKDINPNGQDGVSFQAVLGNKYYFMAYDDVHGQELWQSDGTSSGTYMIKDITSGGSTTISNLSLVGGKLFFSVAGNIWVSDGTNDGTKMLEPSSEIVGGNDIHPFQYITLNQSDSDLVTATISLSDSTKGTLSQTTISSTTLQDMQAQLRGIVFTPLNLVAGGIVFAQVVINDGKQDSESYSQAITVAARVNNEPTINIDSAISTRSGVAKAFSYTYSDVDGDTVTAVEKTAPSHGALVINSTSITYTPNVGYTGNDSFVLTLSDGYGFSIDKTIAVTVLSNTLPTKPTITNTNIVSIAGNNVIGSLQASDADGDQVNFSIVSGNDNGYFSIDSNNNLVVNNANTNLTQSRYTLEIKSSDGKDEQVSTIVFFVVQPLTFNYQGFLSKAGQAVSADLSMTFKLYLSADDSVVQWSTTKMVSVKDGVYNVVIGLGEQALLNSLDMLSNDYYMGISIESNSEMLPRQLVKPSGFTRLLIDKVNILESQVK